MTALDAFDRLRVREVISRISDTASAFPAKFQSIATSLDPDEKIKLRVDFTREGVELLKAVLSDPHANKICSLRCNVRELDFHNVSGVDGNRLGGALAVHLRAKGLDRLHFYDCEFADETLAVVGAEIDRIKRLEIFNNLNTTSIVQITFALQSPNNEMAELALGYIGPTMSSIGYYLALALKHPNCKLVKLRLWAYLLQHQAITQTIEDKFCNQRALFVLLQGQQVRRKVPCQLR
ncbi:hypothetical protein BASA81_007822 [Batrachochytrium salamandrivorans]|nr:hypothetical protein BASA81_007822 [Batrachochytrium salamandrivorans]